MQRRMIQVICLMLILLVSGCQSAGFYSQAILGGSRLLLTRQDTDTLLASPETDPALRERILMVNELLDFSGELGLESHGAYRSYVETGQPYVIWNVFAAEPFNLTLKESCFPIAGCVTYRGYFKQAQAHVQAALLEEQGYEVYVGGVTAYSTLGWFDDPLLDTFLFRSDERLAALIFHELAHQVVYVPDDTRFNESLATAIERYALEQWLAAHGMQDRFTAWALRRDQQDAVIKLINETRERLKRLYASGLDVTSMVVGKQLVIDELRSDYQNLMAQWDPSDESAFPFYYWMEQEINNAKLETVADYHQWVPALTYLLQTGSFGAFKQRLMALAALDIVEREAALMALQQQSVGAYDSATHEKQ